jgi:predicted transglutaminase-like cysteine proteinase
MVRIILTMFLAMTMQAQADSAWLQTGALSSTPRGWVQFCDDNPQECRDATPHAKEIKLDRANYKIIETINADVNTTIKQVSDQEQYGVSEYWAFPTSGMGDCEDFVLEKKRRLIQAGFSKSALLITIVRDLKGEGHAILTIKTDKGDVILDNQVKKPVFWYQTGYQFIKRQAEENPNHWLALGTGNAGAVASTGK